MRVVANLARTDLAKAGIGSGRYGFDIIIPGGLSPLARHVLHVRREADGAELPGSPAVIEAAGGFDAGLQQAVASAVAAIGTGDDRDRALSFILEQAERLRQQRADVDGRRAERLVQRRLRLRWGPQAEVAPGVRREFRGGRGNRRRRGGLRGADRLRRGLLRRAVLCLRGGRAAPSGGVF
jgi:hypothetical protein